MMTEDDLLRLITGLSRRDLRIWVHRGWVRTQTADHRPTFAEIDVARARLIHEMRQDLKVNDEGIPILLSLIDQVYSLRRELRRLGSAVEAQPDSVRRSILEYMRGSSAD